MARSDTSGHVLDEMERHVLSCPWGCRAGMAPRRGRLEHARGAAGGEYCPVGVGLYRIWRSLLAIERARERREPEVRVGGVLVVLGLTPVWVRTGNDQMEDDPGPEYAEARILRGPNRVGRFIFQRQDTGRCYLSYEGHIASVGLSPSERDQAARDFRGHIEPEWRRRRDPDGRGQIVHLPVAGHEPADER